MKQQNTIGVYEAHQAMRRLTDENKPFSIYFQTYSAKTGKSTGRVRVDKAMLRFKNNKAKYSDFLVPYFDLETMQNRQFWLPLLLEFNHQKTLLK